MEYLFSRPYRLLFTFIKFLFLKYHFSCTNLNEVIKKMSSFVKILIKWYQMNQKVCDIHIDPIFKPIVMKHFSFIKDSQNLI